MSRLTFNTPSTKFLEQTLNNSKKKGALYILNLKEIRCLSEAAVDHVVKETQKVFRHTFGRVRAGVNERLAQSGINPDEIPSLNQFWSSIEQPIQGLHSTFLQEKIYREQLGCTVSSCYLVAKTLWIK